MINDNTTKTILLVEDEAIISIVITKTLKRFGYNVLTAGSGEKAVEICSSSGAIDLILMDIDLGSGIDGTEAAKQILAFREIPIVFHTSHSEQEMVDRVRGITRYGYVIKSSGDFVLQSSIEMAFELVEAHKKIKASEEHFYAMFDRAPLGYQSLDENGCFLEVNQKWLETLGYSRDEVVGRWFGDFLAPEFVDAFRDRFPIFKAQGKIHSEFEMIHKNGSRRYIAFEGRVGYQEDGSFKQTHCILSDDTERKKAEDALAVSQKNFELIIKRMINAFVSFESVFNEQGEFVSYRFLYINDAYENITGVKNDDVRGRTVHEVWPETEDSWVKRYGEVALTGEASTFEMYHDPTKKMYHCNVYRPGESRDRFCVIFEDITERKRSEEEIRLKNEELSALNEELNATIEEMEATNEELTAAMEEMEATNEELITTNELVIEREQKLEISESLFRGLFNSMTSGSAIYTVINDGSRGADYIVKSFNEASLKMEGKILEDVVGKSLFDLRPEIDNYGLISILKKVWDTGEPAFFPVKIYQDDHFSNYYDNYIFRIPSGEVVTIYNDVTDRMLVDDELKKSRELLRETEQTGKIGGWVFDVATLTQKWTEETFRILEVDLTDGEPVVPDGVNFFTPESRPVVEEAIQRAIEYGEPYNLELEVITAKGNRRWVHSVAKVNRIDGRTITVSGSFQDITDRKKAELELRESQDNLARIIKNSSELICEIDEHGKYTFVSERYKDLLGYSPDELLGQSVSEKMHPDDVAAAVAKHGTVKSEKGVSVDEWRFRHKNGSYHTFQCRGSVYIDGNGSPKTVVVAHDITGSKQIEDTQLFLIMSGSHLSGGDDFFQSLARYLAETLKMDFVCIDKLIGGGLSARTVAVYFDGEFEDNIEYALKDTPCGEVAGKSICKFEENVRGLFPEDLVLQEMKAESYAGVTLWGSSGEPIGLIAVIGREKMDDPVLAESILKMVSIRAAGELERRDAEEKIKGLLLEKDILLKEVHHRIKNNMNTINGLLTLQAESLTDPAAVDALKDAESRVQSMMVLYDKLYRSDNYNEVAISEYLPGLIAEITENFPNKKNVQIESSIEDFILEVQTLLPIGIIVNELITNTMKYAFTGRDSGLIKISAELRGSKAVLAIEDDGVGIPEFITFKNSSGFGMQLVAMLTEQINGNIRIERDKGTRFVLEFTV